MKLQEFLASKKICAVCGSSIIFSIIDYSDLEKPIHMNADQIFNLHVLKFYHKNLSIFINAKYNNYMIIPNNSRKIDLRIQGHCTNNNDHYLCKSQMDVLDYKEKTWAILPNIEILVESL